MTKEDLIFDLSLLRSHRSGMDYATIAAENGISYSSVSNRIVTALRYQHLVDTDLWKAFESVGANPQNIMAIYHHLKLYLTYRCYPVSEHFKNLRYKDDHSLYSVQRTCSGILKYIRSRSNAELTKLKKEWGIGDLRFGYIKKVHDQKGG